MVGIATTVTALGILPVFLTGALAVQMRPEVGLSVSDLGTATAVFFLASAVSSSFAGRLAEIVGASIGMRSAMTLAAFVCAGISFTHSRFVLFALLLLGGLANATGQVAANLFIAKEIVPSRLGFGYGFKQGGVPVATLLGGVAVPTVGLTLGWEWAFRIAAVVSAAVALKVPRLDVKAYRPRLRQAGSLIDSPLSVLILLAAASGLGAAAANSLGAFFVDSSVGEGVAEGVAGALFAAGSGLGLATRLVVGWAADRASGGRLLWVAVMLAFGSVGYGLLALGTTWALFLATILCFAGGWGWPGLFNFAVVIRNPKAPAAATGITQTGAYMGGIVGPFLFGLMAERSYPAAWTAAAVCALLAAGSVVASRRLLLARVEASPLANS
ncbi:MAG: MFS transporter [Actinomycetota bacterium]|nr:MFS transporter [Actinomycetota bacterium]